MTIMLSPNIALKKCSTMLNSIDVKYTSPTLELHAHQNQMTIEQVFLRVLYAYTFRSENIVCNVDSRECKAEIFFNILNILQHRLTPQDFFNFI